MPIVDKIPKMVKAPEAPLPTKPTKAPAGKVAAKVQRAISSPLTRAPGAKPLIIDPNKVNPPPLPAPEMPELDLPPGVATPKGPVKPRRIPTLKAKYKPTDIQKQFVDFVEKNDGIGLAAHKAGAGKTAGSLMAFLNLVKKGRAQKALVVVPAGLRVNFADKGVKKFTDASVGIIGSKSEIAADSMMDPKMMGDKDMYVISYDMFKKDPNYYLGITGADTVIADEIHKYKDPQTKLHKVIKTIRPNIQNFIGLSATPAMNNPHEAVSIINAISKKKMTKDEFKKKFYATSAGPGVMNLFGLLGHKDVKGAVTGWKNQQEMAEMVGSKYHFAEPKQGDMPEKVVDVVRVPMSETQTHNYTGILNKRLTKIERKILSEGQLVPETQLKKIVNKVMAARQLSNDTGYVRGVRRIKDNPKALSMMVDTMDHLKSTPRGQIVMFSNFIGHGIDVMEDAMKDAKISYGRFTGRDKRSDREQAIKDYNAGKIKVLLVSGAGAEGLDLPNTTMVQMMDGNYNPEKITQSEGRGIRRGGLSYLPEKDRKVMVKRYVAVPSDSSMSVDESIYNIAAKKAELIRQFKEIVKKWQSKRK